MSTIVVQPVSTRRVPAVRRPAPAVRTPRPVSPLRLTRRGRVVLRLAALLLGLAAVAALVLVGGRVAHADGSAHAVPVGYHVVLPGESLWQIAAQVAPDADRNRTVDRIVELNALTSGRLAAGQRLAVPLAG